MTDSHPPLLIAPPPPGWSPQPVAVGDADRLARRAMTFGIVSLVANVVLLPSIIGIVYGRRALRTGTTRRSEATAGVVTGAIGLAFSVLAIVVVLPLSMILRTAASTELEHGIENSIVTLAAHQGVTLTDVTCPAPQRPQQGTVLDCTAVSSTDGTVQVQVTFTSATTFTARVLPAGAVG